ncbi:hypothetical protein, partial [Methylobrevis pamukkalensis]|uniref:hypothetical protein n=1 Tax=Methylobrevis pamukkalensis TaxID=1439726 RepID=UPI001AED006F
MITNRIFRPMVAATSMMVLAAGFTAAPVTLDFADGLTLKASEAQARRGRGADDGAGHVGGGKGADDGAGHTRRG